MKFSLAFQQGKKFKNFLKKEILIRHSIILADFFNKGRAKWSHVEYFLNTFSNVLPNDDEKIDHLYEEFSDCKTRSIWELPDTALTDALISSYESHDEYQLDTI